MFLEGQVKIKILNQFGLSINTLFLINIIDVKSDEIIRKYFTF